MSAFFFFNDTATTEIYTLSLHDALPISVKSADARDLHQAVAPDLRDAAARFELRFDFGREPDDLARIRILTGVDRKSTRLNSSHANISYAVFCLKKKKTKRRSLQAAAYR